MTIIRLTVIDLRTLLTAPAPLGRRGNVTAGCSVERLTAHLLLQIVLVLVLQTRHGPAERLPTHVTVPLLIGKTLPPLFVLTVTPVTANWLLTSKPVIFLLANLTDPHSVLLMLTPLTTRKTILPLSIYPFGPLTRPNWTVDGIPNYVPLAVTLVVTLASLMLAENVLSVLQA